MSRNKAFYFESQQELKEKLHKFSTYGIHEFSITCQKCKKTGDVKYNGICVYNYK